VQNLALLPNAIDPDHLLSSFGLLGLLIIIFAECGLLVGFFLPGDTLLFSAGRLFRQEYVDRSHEFFDRYGARTIVLARFVPIVRTFATVMAGASRMRFRTYAIYSVIGGVLWGAGVLALGYYLGHIPFVRNTLEPLIEPILIAVVVLSMVPAAVELLRSRRRRGGMSSAPLRDEPIGPDGTVEDTARPVSGGRHRID
jgi:membrane-associated protein